MRLLLTMSSLLILTAPAIAQSCSSLESQISQQMAQLNNPNLGMCEMAQRSVALYEIAAQHASQCQGSEAQADEYRQALYQAQQTANASCN